MTSGIEAPTGIDLNPRPPAAVRVRKAVGILFIAAFGFIILLIFYGLYSRRQAQRQGTLVTDTQAKATPATTAAHEIVSQIPLGLADSATQSVRGEYEGVTEIPSNPASEIAQIGVRPIAQRTLQAPAMRESFSRRPEASWESGGQDPIARREQEAVESPITTGSNATGATSRQADVSFVSTPPITPRPKLAGGSSEDPVAVLGGAMQGADYGAQNAQDEKALFISRSRTRQAEAEFPLMRTAPISRFEVKAGWDIPATLEQAINSDQPGEIRALVRESVYDTATGKYLLIPQGSRLVGSYNSAISYAQDGVQAVWDRIIFPDASSLDLKGMIGQDAKGQAGLRYDVDHHYPRLVGFAVLTSLFSAGFQLSQNRTGSVLAQPTAGQVVASAVGGEVSQLGAEITRRNLNVQPTIRIPAGYRFNVRVHKDLIFDAPFTRGR